MGKPLIPAQRRERIQEYLAIHQIARTGDLCNLLETSEATVRRDLEWLEQKGILERTHGGAILSQRVIFEQEYQQRAQHYPEEKRRIGELAASLIEEGDIVFINSGTTATQVLQHIRRDSRITVFTNNVNAALEIGDPGFLYYLTGGEFQSRSNSLAGRFALDNLNLVFANKVILGVDGISLKHGCTVPTNAEAEVVRRYGVRPDQVPDFIALRGDPSDGLPGAKGIGEKRARDLYEREAVYRSWSDVELHDRMPAAVSEVQHSHPAWPSADVRAVPHGDSEAKIASQVPGPSFELTPQRVQPGVLARVAIGIVPVGLVGERVQADGTWCEWPGSPWQSRQLARSGSMSWMLVLEDFASWHNAQSSVRCAA